MVSQKLFDELNLQFNYELYSSNFYLSLASYFSSEDLDGFSNFFKIQAEEERLHAMKIYDYILDMGGRVLVDNLEKPQFEFSSPLEAFEKGLEHERFVTKRFYLLADIAAEEKEHTTISFLKWFIDEQREEENSFSKIVKKLKITKDNPAALFMIDSELAQRQLTPLQ